MLKGILLVTSILLLASPALAQEDLFRGRFEFGSTFDWSRSTEDLVIALPSGGSLELRQGSFVKDALITIAPVPTPELPAGVTVYGQAYAIDVDPPLLLPAKLSLPVPADRGIDDPWGVIELTESQRALLEQLTNDMRTASVVVPVIHDDVIRLAATIDEGFHVVVTVDSGPFHIGDRVSILFGWDFPAKLLGWQFGDGSGIATEIPDNRRFQTVTHEYQSGGAFTLEWEVRPVDDRSATRIGTETILIEPGPAGRWYATAFGTLDFRWEGNDLVGKYTPGQAAWIDGTLSGTTYDGFWIESASSRTCDSTKLDAGGVPSPHWGTVEIEFSEEFNTLCGTWAYCDDAQTQPWEGIRFGGESPDC